MNFSRPQFLERHDVGLSLDRTKHLAPASLIFFEVATKKLRQYSYIRRLWACSVFRYFY